MAKYLLAVAVLSVGCCGPFYQNGNQGVLDNEEKEAYGPQAVEKAVSKDIKDPSSQPAPPSDARRLQDLKNGVLLPGDGLEKPDPDEKRKVRDSVRSKRKQRSKGGS